MRGVLIGIGVGVLGAAGCAGPPPITQVAPAPAVAAEDAPPAKWDPDRGREVLNDAVGRHCGQKAGDPGCLDRGRSAVQRIVQHISAGNGLSEPILSPRISSLTRAEIILERCLGEHGDDATRSLDAEAAWLCIEAGHVEAVREARAAERKSREHAERAARWNALVDRYIEESYTLCRERNPGSEHYCYGSNYIPSAAHELAGYHFGKLPWHVRVEVDFDMAPVVERCIEQAMDGELVYAPFATACMKATIEGQAYRERRRERIKEERAD